MHFKKKSGGKDKAVLYIGFIQDQLFENEHIMMFTAEMWNQNETWRGGTTNLESRGQERFPAEQSL